MAERNHWRLALRIAARQWRAGDLWLIATAGVLAVAITTLIAALGDRLERGLVHRAADMLGADLVLTGGHPPTPAELAVAPKHRLALVAAADFSTMLRRKGTTDEGDVILVAVRAAGDGYPLRGELRVHDVPATANADTNPGDRVAATGPRPGEAWIEPRISADTGIAIGDRVEIGRLSLRVTALVVSEPDRAGDFSAVSPRVLMNRADLDATGVIQPGSRVRYRTLFAGGDADVAAAKKELDNLHATDEEVIDVHGGNRRTASSLSRALQFLSLAAILGVLLCGATLGLVADRQARRLYDTAALLRTFGMSRRAVRNVLLLEILSIALVAGVVGAVLGYGAQQVLATLMADLLPARLPAPGAAAALAGLACAFIALPAFLLPPLASLAEVPPLRVLRRDLAPPSLRTVRQYALGLGALALLLVLTSRERVLALELLAGTAAFALAGIPLAAMALRLLTRRRARLSLPVRMAADRLAYTPLRSGAQLLAFALILAVLTLSTLLRNDLFASWQRQLPANAPNLFAMNLLPGERDAFLRTLAGHGVEAPLLYPVTPGRLLRIGDQALAARTDMDPAAMRALDRDLSLTVGTDSPGAIVQGDPITVVTKPGFVSVESKLAGQLHLEIGDRLTFVVAGEQVRAQVSGFRRVEWDSFQPNFYMVLSPGTLGQAPYTWLSSFHTAQPHALVRELRGSFPAITLVEVGPLLERLGGFIASLAAGIGFVAALLFAAALLLLIASVVATLDERLAEAALLRALGARRTLLVRTLAAEFALLGAGSGLLAAAGTEIARRLVYARMELAWAPMPALLLLPVVAALVLAATGVLAARRSLDTSAGTLLRPD